jgi:hypothetical protein
VVVELPSTLRSGVSDPGHWLLVATAFNVLRVLALGLAIGLVTRAEQTGADPHDGSLAGELFTVGTRHLRRVA